MSRSLSLALLLALTLPAPAAIITSGGYVATDEVPFTFTDLTTSPGAARIGAGLDSGLFPVALGFAFTFFGETHTTAALTVDGALTFRGSGVVPFNQNLLAPQNLLPAMIAPWWDDLAGGEAIYFQTLGAPGSRVFLAQWNRTFPFSARMDSITFQLALEEGTNAIELRYLDATTTGIFHAGGSATVGITETRGHLTGQVLQWSFNQPVLRDGETIRIVPLPEPGSFLLFGIGGLALWIGKRSLTKRPSRLQPN